MPWAAMAGILATLTVFAVAGSNSLFRRVFAIRADSVQSQNALSSISAGNPGHYNASRAS